MDIGGVLSRAWQIIWRHKILWIFGILASCSNNANGGGSNFRYSFESGQVPPEWQRFFDQFNNLFSNMPQWQIYLLAGIAILVVLFLVILAIFLGTIGRIGLIRGTQQAEQGAERLEFGGLFSDSLPYFWRVFGLNLLIGLAIFLLVLILVIPFTILAVVTFGLIALCIIPLICILIPLGWFLSIVIEQANIAIVVENLGILDGLRRGWEVARANLGMMIIMGLILYLGVSLIGGIIIALPLGIVVIPALVGTATGTDQGLQGGLLTAAICFIAYLPVMLVLSGILRAYIESAWTLTYMRLTHKPTAPELAPVAM